MEQQLNFKEILKLTFIDTINRIKNNTILKLLVVGLVLSIGEDLVMRKTDIEKDEVGRIIEIQKNRFTGKKDGLTITYKMNGDIEEINEYKNDKLDGFSADFRQDGIYTRRYQKGAYVSAGNLSDWLDANTIRFIKQPIKMSKKMVKEFLGIEHS